MILENNSLDERCLNIYEMDLTTQEKVLILTVYATRRDNSLWTFPQPQIYKDKIYEMNKGEYDKQILAFRNDCESLEGEKGSILASEVENLKQELTVTQEALNEILFMNINEEVI